MKTFMKITKSLFGIFTITVGLVPALFCGCREQLPEQITVESRMPTAEEAVKRAIWEAGTKYKSFDVLSTNVTELDERHTYRGEKRGGDAEVTVEKQVFGASYDAWSKGDSFSRMETNYLCNLIITHIKPKPKKDISTLIITDWEAEPGDKDAPPELRQRAMMQLLKYSHSKVVREETYKVNRIVGGEVMKCIDRVNQVYVWNTEERNTYHVQPTWVIYLEVSNLQTDQ